MKFLEQVQADLKQAVLKHQRDLLLRVLQGRSGALTFGDLRKLLASPLGRGLDDIRVAALFAAPTASPRKVDRKGGRKQRSVGKVAPRTAKATRKTRTKGVAAGPQRKARASKRSPQGLLEAVVGTLQSAKEPLSSPQIAAAVKRDRTTVRKVLHRLSAEKRVTISGSRQFTRYVLASPDGPQQREPTNERRSKEAVTKASERRTAAARPTTRSRDKRKSAITKPTAPAVLTEADYDAAVLAQLRATGSISSTQLQMSVGGTLNEVRAALQRLIARRQVTRVGERKATRYVPYGPKSAGTADV